MPADKIHINDWRPPPPATMPSPLDEENQLDALHVYANRLKEDLASHQNIQEPMSKLVGLFDIMCVSELIQQYTPGSKNLNKARENWTAKSRYMLTEIHKYETYIEALRAAIALRVKKQGEKKLDRSLRRSFGSLHLLNEDEGGDDGRATPTGKR
jgi:PH/SEC7 domain-containing protein